jgi:hypothetical protein
MVVERVPIPKAIAGVALDEFHLLGIDTEPVY